MVVVSACGRVSFDATAGTPDSATSAADVGVDGGDDGGGGDGSSATGDGYFVEVTAPGGAMGGIAGANSLCLTELTTGTWNGKLDAQAAGQLVGANVKAWLCTATACQDLQPNRLYRYASTASPTRGGGAFTATNQGFLANDGRAYSDDDAFGPDSGFVDYMTGRQADNTPQATTCSDWTTFSGTTSVAVNDTPFYPERLSKYVVNCDFVDHAICIVDPL
jgi:hypothetical protein